MVTKKKTAKKRTTRRVYAAPAKKRTKKSDASYIPGAIATVGLVAVNAKNIKDVVNAWTNNGRASLGDIPSRMINGFTGTGWVHDTYGKFIKKDQIVADAAVIAGGYVGGELFKKYAPSVIKKPVAKLAKKIPKVI